MGDDSVFETACFATGWFWTPDSSFGVLKGVLRTRVGYTGGKKSSPTYHDMGDHTESIQIDYNTNILSYSDLLDVFWESHSPCSPGWGKQYMHAVFYMNEEQHKIALKSKKALKAKKNAKITTSIKPMTVWTDAEDYHQKYYLRNTNFFSDLNLDDQQVINSLLAARLNGWVYGNGTLEQFEEEINNFGLSSTLVELISKSVRRRLTSWSYLFYDT